MRRFRLILVALVSVAAVAVAWPVGGQIWRVQQVEQMAIIVGEKRAETTWRVVINDAMVAARADRLRRVWFALKPGRQCYPRDLEFLTARGWLPIRIHCPDGLFLDFYPFPPGFFNP